MSLSNRIDEDMKTAMREGSTEHVSTLRLLKSSLKNEQIKVMHDLSEDEQLKVLQREAKQRRDSISAYVDGGRDDLANAEKAELAIITGYLPKQLSDDELSKIVDAAIAETGATSMAQMGQVIGAVMKQTAGRAEGGAVSRLVKQKLGN
jgi:uncharacterized protein YqeY